MFVGFFSAYVFVSLFTKGTKYITLQVVISFVIMIFKLNFTSPRSFLYFVDNPRRSEIIITRLLTTSIAINSY